MKEIKCYTCKNKNLDPVPDDLPCVDCWNELSYVNYEPETLEKLKKEFDDKKWDLLDWLNSARKPDDELMKLTDEMEAILKEIEERETK